VAVLTNTGLCAVNSNNILGVPADLFTPDDLGIIFPVPIPLQIAPLP
jgi:hypothetical protein